MRTRASHRSLIVVASVLLGSMSAAPAFAQPVANPDSYTTNEDSTLNVGGNGVRSNDNLAGFGNNADAIVLAGPSHGTLTLGQNGNFTYVPSANFNGTDTFTYRLRYPTNNFSNAATVTIVVNPVNDAPTGVVNRSYTTAEDVPLSIAAPGVLAGVTDPDGPVTAAVVSNPSAAAGTLSLSANGAFTFNPAAGFSGNATFTYRAVDSRGGQSATATVTIAVSSVNDPPVANANSYTTTEDIAAFNVAAPGVLANDTDPDTGSVLTAVLVTSVPASAGTLTLNANGSFTFRPALNFSGVTSFTYNARDNATPPGVSATPATVTITVTAVNDAPTAVADVFATTENVPLVVPARGILANDTDVDSSTLTALLVASVAASSGTLSPITSGGFTYTPANGFSGSATFTYRAVDNATPSAQSANRNRDDHGDGRKRCAGRGDGRLRRDRGHGSHHRGSGRAWQRYGSRHRHHADCAAGRAANARFAHAEREWIVHLLPRARLSGPRRFPLSRTRQWHTAATKQRGKRHAECG